MEMAIYVTVHHVCNDTSVILFIQLVIILLPI